MSLVPLHQRVPILSTILTSYRSQQERPHFPFPSCMGPSRGVSPLTLKSRSQLEPTPSSQPSRPTRLSVLASEIHYFLLTSSGQACIISCLDY